MMATSRTERVAAEVSGVAYIVYEKFRLKISCARHEAENFEFE